MVGKYSALLVGMVGLSGCVERPYETPKIVVENPDSVDLTDLEHFGRLPSLEEMMREVRGTFRNHKLYATISNDLLFLDTWVDQGIFKCTVSDLKNGTIIIDDKLPSGPDHATYDKNNFLLGDGRTLSLDSRVNVLYMTCVLVTYQAVTDKTKEVIIHSETFSSYYDLIEEEKERERKIEEEMRKRPILP